ncbi:MAG: sigma factor [Fuerstiella sp.]
MTFMPLCCAAGLRKYLVQDADADDLVRDVLTTVARELPCFVHDQRTGAFRNWLRQILVHRLQNFWRARQYRPATTGADGVIS